MKSNSNALIKLRRVDYLALITYLTYLPTYLPISGAKAAQR